MFGRLKFRVAKAGVAVLAMTSAVAGLTVLASPAHAAACGYKGEAYAIGDTIQDANGVWWQCTRKGWQKLL